MKTLDQMCLFFRNRDNKFAVWNIAKREKYAKIEMEHNSVQMTMLPSNSSYDLHVYLEWYASGNSHIKTAFCFRKKVVGLNQTENKQNGSDNCIDSHHMKIQDPSIYDSLVSETLKQGENPTSKNGRTLLKFDGFSWE